MIKRTLLTVTLILTSLIMMGQKQTYTPELLWKLGRVGEATLSPDGKQILYGITYYDAATNKSSRDLYLISADGGAPMQITKTAVSEYGAIWRPDGLKIAYMAVVNDAMQVFEMNPDGTEVKQITAIEGGIEGFQYAPTMDKILFTKSVKLDPNVQDMHPDLPLADALVVDDLMYRHWNHWTTHSYSHVFVADYPALKNVTDIMEGERFACPIPNYGGIEEVTFSPDGKKIAYTSKKKVGKDFAVSTNADIYIYDIAAKTTTNLSAPNAGYDINPVFSADGNLLVWSSMEDDGFESDKKRIFIHNFKEGKTINYSEKFAESAATFTFSEDAKTLYFLSAINATYQIFSLNIKKGEFKQITKGKHNYTAYSIVDDVLIAAKESMVDPSDLYRVDLKTGEAKQLTFVNQELLKDVASITTEERWVTTSDGKKMLVWVILPPNFDKNKKYPAILYCQGGPQSAVSQFFSYRWNFQMMASRGYVVVAPNRRGLPSFGEEWNDAISLDYGGQCMRDYLSAIDDVAKESYVDKERLGCVGASFGGFSVYWLAGNHENRFKAFIAHCGMFNLESWYATTEELFFANHDIGGPYWEKGNEKSYAISPHHYVQNWNTPLMVIHGGRDFRIPYTEGMQAYNIAQIKGIPSKFLYFPDETHFVVKPQNSILWQREFMNWLDKWLKN